MGIVGDSCVEVNISELEKEILALEKQLNERRVVLSYAKKKQGEKRGYSTEVNLIPEIPSLGIEASDVTYLNDNLLRKSEGRVNLHKLAMKRTGKPVHYQDFVKRVNQLGDDIKEASYYATIWRTHEHYGIKKLGGGFFDLERGTEAQEMARNIFGY